MIFFPTKVHLCPKSQAHYVLGGPWQELTENSTYFRCFHQHILTQAFLKTRRSSMKRTKRFREYGNVIKKQWFKTVSHR